MEKEISKLNNNINYLNEIVQEAYTLIGRHLTQKFNVWFSERTIKNVQKIQAKYPMMSIEDIQHILIQKYIELGKHREFDPGMSSLFTYTGRFTFEHTRALKKVLDDTYKGCEFIILDDFFLDEFLWKNTSVKLRQENILDVGGLMPPHKSQEDALNRLVDYTTPEDLLVRKEFMEAVNDHYDEIDIMVLSGIVDRKSVAAELSLKEDTYGKRLQRKNAAFKVVFTQAGHC